MFVWCTLKIHQSLSLTSFWCRWILTRHLFIKITWEKPTISIHSLILWFKHQNKLINTLSTQVLWYITSCSWCAFQYPHFAINITVYYIWYIGKEWYNQYMFLREWERYFFFQTPSGPTWCFTSVDWKDPQHANFMGISHWGTHFLTFNLN